MWSSGHSTVGTTESPRVKIPDGSIVKRTSWALMGGAWVDYHELTGQEAFLFLLFSFFSPIPPPPQDSVSLFLFSFLRQDFSM